MAQSVQVASLPNLPSVIPDGARNNTLMKEGRSFWAKQDKQHPDFAALEEHLRIINNERCQPPLPESELAELAKSVAAKPAGLSPEYEAKRKEAKQRRKKSKDDSFLTDFKPWKCNDLWLGRRFGKVYKEKLAYIPDSKSWAIYNGVIWLTSASAGLEAGKCIDRFIDAVVSFAYANKWSDFGRKPDLPKALAYQKTHNRETLLREAQKQLSRSELEFDTDRNLLNVMNGTIELDTLTFREHRASDLITKVANCSYNPKAIAPRWIGHLERAFAGHDEVKRFMQARFGYALTGNTTRACFYILYGKPRAGKSITADTILNVLGDYAATTDVKIFTSDSHGSEQLYELNRIRGSRVIIGSEFDPKHKLDAQTLKRITGGGEVTARPMYGQRYNYLPTYYCFFDSNHFPQLYDDTVFQSGRAVVIPFFHPLPPADRDEGLQEKLLTEESKSGILNWLLDGLRLERAFGRLPVPKECYEMAMQFRDENDLIGLFISECLEVADDPQKPCEGKAIFEDYRAWATEGGYQPLPQQAFYRELGNRNGIQRADRKTKYGGKVISAPFYGVQLKNTNTFKWQE